MKKLYMNDTNFAPAYKGLGYLYYLNGQQKIAKKYYARFIELTGNNIPGKIDYLKTLYKAKDYNEAFNIAQEILHVDTSKIFVYRIAAYSGFEMEKPDVIAFLALY